MSTTAENFSGFRNLKLFFENIKSGRCPTGVGFFDFGATLVLFSGFWFSSFFLFFFIIIIILLAPP